MHTMRMPSLLRFISAKRSFRYRLIVSFCILSIMPVIVIQIVSYYNIAGKLQKKIDALENINLVQTRKTIRTKLDFYEDLLHQMYTDDHIIELVNKVNNGENIEFNSGQLRRALHSYAYAMPYVQSIVVLASSGRMVFDDLLTGYNTKTSWLDIAGGQPSRLYQSVIEGNETCVFPSQLASFYAPKNYYLFHLAHRLIDYKDIWIKNGIVILSIDERMLGEICDERPDPASGGTVEDSIFILSGDGTVVSYPDKSYVGKRLDLPADPSQRRDAIRRMVTGAAAQAPRGCRCTSCRRRRRAGASSLPGIRGSCIRKYRPSSGSRSSSSCPRLPCSLRSFFSLPVASRDRSASWWTP